MSIGNSQPASNRRKMRVGLKGDTIQFYCDPAWKRLAASKASLMGKTLTAVCVQAVSQYLGIPEKLSEESQTGGAA